MQFDIKQKFILVLTVGAFAFLGYEVYQLVGQAVGGSVSEASPIPQKVSSVPARPRISQKFSATQPKNTPVVEARFIPPSAKAPIEQPAVQPAALHASMKSLPLLKNQKAYLEIVNQFELAKMKRQLLQEQLAIASAQAKLVKLRKEAGLASGMASDMPGYTGHAQQYQLSYVDKQSGQWSAGLTKHGVYFQVELGTKLPDGSRVANINRSGVTLVDNNKKNIVTFNGVIVLKQPNVPSVMQVASQVSPKTLPKLHQRLQSQAMQKMDVSRAVTSAKAVEYALQEAQAKVMAVKQPVTPKVVQKDSRLVMAKPASALKLKPVIAAAPATKKMAANKVETKRSWQQEGLFHIELASQSGVPVHETAAKKTPNVILDTPSNHYAIQLIGSYNPKVVEDFAKTNKLLQLSHVFAVKNKGKNWYMLIVGDYSNLDEAESALAQLPKPLRVKSPWIRRYSSIQSAMKSN